MTSLICVVVSCVYVSCTKALYWDEAHLQYYDSATVTVNFSTSHADRRHRSVDVMPDVIKATVHVRGSDVRLGLRRNRQASAHVPVYTVSNGQCVQRHEHGVGDWGHSGFYQDVQSGASMYITKTDRYLQPFDLEGPLVINGTTFLLTPSRDLVAMHDGARAHQLKKIMTRIDFSHDVRDERSSEQKQERALRAEIRRARRHQLTRHFRPDVSSDGRRETDMSDDVIYDARQERRQSAVTHTVEMTIVADFKIFDRFLTYTKGNRDKALMEMKLYYIFMTNLMDIRYASVTTLDPSLVIRIALVSLVVADIQGEAVWTEGNKLGQDSVNAERALYSFRDWMRQTSDVPSADHWMLFSGYDLAESSGTTATIGIAFIGTLCTDSAVSVVEEYFTATTGAVSAHELGHSLDADHDDMYQYCSDEDSHVMSTIATFPREESLASNPWQFSPCSVDAFGAYLDTIKCALRPPPKSISSNEIGGLYLDADEQCELAMGSGSYFCRTVQSRVGYDLACRRLYCYLPNDPGYCASIVPQEYTLCNNHKWCERGRCIYHRDAPPTVDNCPQGDEKHYDCQKADCNKPKVRDAYCCYTCAQRRGVTASVDVTSASIPLSGVGKEDGVDVSTRSFSPPPAWSSSTPVTPLSTTGCDDLICRCRQEWSFVCNYLYR